jgi:hypothetical protein
VIDMSNYDQVPLGRLREAEQELAEAIATLHEQEIEARNVLRLHYGVTVASRAYRRSKPGPGIKKIKKAIVKSEAQRRDAERILDAIRARIVELEAQ